MYSRTSLQANARPASRNFWNGLTDDQVSRALELDWPVERLAWLWQYHGPRRLRTQYDPHYPRNRAGCPLWQYYYVLLGYEVGAYELIRCAHREAIALSKWSRAFCAAHKSRVDERSRKYQRSIYRNRHAFFLVQAQMLRDHVG